MRHDPMFHENPPDESEFGPKLPIEVQGIDTFDGAKPRFLNRGKKRRSVLTLRIRRASARGVGWIDLVVIASDRRERGHLMAWPQDGFVISPAETPGNDSLLKIGTHRLRHRDSNGNFGAQIHG